jgi:hypothetical protein
MGTTDGSAEFCGWNIDDIELLAFAEAQTCPADLDGDGTVDVSDLLALLAAWGEIGVPADLNGDGVVEVSDLLLLLGAWGAC